MGRYWAVLLVAASCLAWPPKYLCLDSLVCAQGTPAVSEGSDESVPNAEPAAEAEESVPVELDSARAAIRTFVLGMETDDVEAAIAAMDFSEIDPAPDPSQKAEYARQLKVVIDHLPLFDPTEIGSDPQGPPYTFSAGENELSGVVVVRGDDGLWQFSADTVAKISAAYEIVKDEPAATELPSTPAATGEVKVDASGAEPAEAGDSEAASKPVPAVEVPDGLRSARQVMRTLVDVLSEGDDARFHLVVASLDCSKLDPDMGPHLRLAVGRDLKYVIERMELIDYGAISDDPEGPPFEFPIKAENKPIKIVRGEDGIWRFSAETVAQVASLRKLYDGRPVLNLGEESKPWYYRELVLGNETWRILSLFLVVFVCLVAGQTLRMAMRLWSARLQRRGRAVVNIAALTLARTAIPVLTLIGLNAGIQLLVLDHSVERAVDTFIHVVFTLIIGYIFFRMVDVIVEILRQLAVRSGSTLNDMLVPIVSTSLRLTVIVLVLLEVLTAVSDQPPSSVIAGLGAGGLAIGLAAQDTIKNFFGSMMIYADRPFELGDRIVVDGHDGPVESVGFRSTRIRTLDGHLITVPNGELAHKTIHNIGKRPYIRRIMDIRVAYDTPPDKVREALAILRELLADHEGMKEEYPPRVFLHDFLDTAINIRAIYWFHPPAYWDYCDFSERLNLEIVERFGTAGIRFALPSQRLFLEGRQEGMPEKG